MCGGLQELSAQTTTNLQLDPSSTQITFDINMSDPVRDLNNALQGHPTGNLTPQFSWVLHTEGPKHQVTHSATAKFRGVEIGHGTGVAQGAAKKQAAIQALQNLKAAGIIYNYQ